MIRMRDVSFSYGGPTVLEGINLDIKRGECVSILGPNGTGKSTLMELLVGHLKPSRGHVLLGNNPVSKWKAREFSQQVAYIPQALNVTFSFQAIEIVTMGTTSRLQYLHAPGASEREQALEALSQLGVRHLAYRYFNELSGGERKLVLLATALCQRTPFILLDEPTSDLDPANAHRLTALLSELAKQENKSIVLTTHAPETVPVLGGRTIFLGGAHILAQGAVENTLTAQNLTQLYGIPFGITRVEGRALPYVKDSTL